MPSNSESNIDRARNGGDAEGVELYAQGRAHRTRRNPPGRKSLDFIIVTESLVDRRMGVGWVLQGK